MSEATRLRFLVDRDGLDAACAWAAGALRTYHAVLRERRTSTLYRRRLVGSCLAFRRFIAGCRRGAPAEATLDEIAAYEARLAAGSAR